MKKDEQSSTSNQDTMFLEYRKFILQATNDRTVISLEALEPGRLQIIREAMERLDHYFNQRDYQNFMKVINDSLEVLKQDIY
jgi:hypothetical protein